MDKKILIEYADMKEEIKDLRRRIAEDKKKIEQLNKITVQDSVACGKKGNKQLRTVKITGFPQREYEKREFLLEKRIAKLQMLETDLLEKQMQVEEYIGQIKKSEIRMILRFYYIDDLSWVQVSHRMNEVFPKKRKAYTEDSCRCKHNRYLEKFEKTTETTVLKC